MPFVPSVREGVVSADGAAVRYYDSADADDPRTPLVLVHGTGGTAQTHFWALLPMLARRHRVIALDLVDPDDNDSTPSPSYYAEQAAVVIRHLSPRHPVSLVGYSLGAVVAAVLAADRPALVRDLTLVAGWVTTDVQQRLRNDIWTSLHRESHPALAELMVFTAYSQGFLLTRTEAEVAELVAQAGKGPDRSLQMRVNRDVDVADEVARIVAPTLVIGCSADQMVPPRHARMLFGGIADARYAEVTSGHAVMTERPAEVYQLIERFVLDPAATPSGTVLDPTHA